jgi:hypothetical protein
MRFSGLAATACAFHRISIARASMAGRRRAGQAFRCALTLAFGRAEGDFWGGLVAWLKSFGWAQDALPFLLALESGVGPGILQTHLSESRGGAPVLVGPKGGPPADPVSRRGNRQRHV